MSYTFFFSYARLDETPDLSLFYEDLVDGVRSLLGSDRTETVGFRDEQRIPLGANFASVLGKALYASKVFVYLSSPTYFQREHCGREWYLFERRMKQHRLSAPGTSPDSQLMIPIVWQMVAEPPRVAQNINYADDGLSKYYLENGMKSLVRRKNDLHDPLRRQYGDTVECLAQLIYKAAKRSTLEHSDDVPEYSECHNAFAAVPQAPAETQQFRTGGPRVAQCYYIVGTQDEMDQLRSAKNLKMEPERYGPERGLDWKPFLGSKLLQQNEEELHCIPKAVQKVIGNLNLFDDSKPDIDIHTIEERLLLLLREAEKKNNVVLLFVDCWSLHIETFGSLMAKYDEQAFINCAVLILCHENDVESVADDDDLIAKTQAIFARQTSHTLKILMANDFHSKVRETLERVRGRIHSRGRVFHDFKTSFLQGQSLPINCNVISNTKM